MATHFMTSGLPHGLSQGRWARYINALLASWLVASTFLWPHTAAERGQNLFVGFVVFVFALSAVLQPSLRALNAIGGIWLFAATMILDHALRATLWHNAALAALFVAFAAVPSSSVRSGQSRTS